MFKSVAMHGDSTNVYRRGKHLFVIGLAAGAAGVLGLLLTWALDHRRDVLDMTWGVSHAMLTIGVIIGAVAWLALKGRSIEEAYALGYDLGFEKGYREGAQTLLDESVADLDSAPRQDGNR